MAKKPLTAVTPSSGNVFADIRVPEPDEELAPAKAKPTFGSPRFANCSGIWSRRPGLNG